MAVAMPMWVQLVLLLCGVCLVLALKRQSSSRKARTGNLIGAGAAVVACAVPFFWSELDLDHVPLILAAIALGTVGGVVGANRVKLAQLPPLVALFNGTGGAAAALVALLELRHMLREEAAFDGLDLFGWSVWAATAFTIVVGSVSFAGSLVTFAKLHELMTSRPLALPWSKFAFGGSLIVTLALAVQLAQTPSVGLGVALGLLGLAVGVLLVLPVGRTDMPVVISLLNASTGLAVAAAGYVLDNPVLLIAGALVGASGTILTLLMARAAGHSVPTILFRQPTTP